MLIEKINMNIILIYKQWKGYEVYLRSNKLMFIGESFFHFGTSIFKWCYVFKKTQKELSYLFS